VNDAPIDTKACGECMFPLCDCGCGSCVKNLSCPAEEPCKGENKPRWFWECECADEESGTGVADSEAEAIADAVQFLIDGDVEEDEFTVGPAQRLRASDHIVSAAGLLFELGELTYNLAEAAELGSDGSDPFTIRDKEAARADLETALRAWADKHVRCEVFTFADDAKKSAHSFEARIDPDTDELVGYFLDGEELSDPEAGT
jgi:hypothetical protein